MCGIFGVIRKPQCILTNKDFKHFIRALGIVSQRRGTDATGVAYNHLGQLAVHKNNVPAISFSFIKSIPNEVKVIMGHTRMATQGDAEFNYNNHPFIGEIDKGKYALAHNGSFYNDLRLKKTKNLPDSEIETDSYVVVQLVDSYKKLNAEVLKKVAEELQGGFMLTFLEEATNDMWFVKGDNPIYLVDFAKLGLIAYASTKEIFEASLVVNKMLYEYYNRNKDKRELVAVYQFFSGDIVKYNYELDLFEYARFEHDSLGGYRFPYSYSDRYKDSKGKNNYQHYSTSNWWWEEDDAKDEEIVIPKQITGEVLPFAAKKEVSVERYNMMWEDVENCMGESLSACELEDEWFVMLHDEDSSVLDFPTEECMYDWLEVFLGEGLEIAKGMYLSLVRLAERNNSEKEKWERQ